MTDEALRTAVQADFARRTEGFTYVSPLPAEQKHPVALPEWLNNDGSVETMESVAQYAQA
jgi:aminobenzoyl-glutamate utilization protein B